MLGTTYFDMDNLPALSAYCILKIQKRQLYRARNEKYAKTYFDQ